MRRHASRTWIMRSCWIALVLLAVIGIAAGQEAQDAYEPLLIEGEAAETQMRSVCGTSGANAEGNAQYRGAEENLGDACRSYRGQEKAHVGFGRVIKDQDVLNLVREHQATLHAVHMWRGGFSGTYRSYEPTSPAQLLQDARQDSIAHFTYSLEGNNVRIQTFADNYSDAEVAQNPDLQHQLRSLLGLRARMRNALAALRSGSPVIYSVEVEADSPHLDTMATDASDLHAQPLDSCRRQSGFGAHAEAESLRKLSARRAGRVHGNAGTAGRTRGHTE